MAILNTADLAPAQKTWLRNVYLGLPQSFTDAGQQYPRQIDTRELSKLLEIKKVETKRREIEAKWIPKFAQIFKYAAGEVSDNYRLSHSVDAALRSVDAYLHGHLVEAFQNLYYETEVVFMRRAKLQLRRKSIFGPDEQKDDQWDIVDPYDVPPMQAWNRKVTAVKIANVRDSTKRRVQDIVSQGLEDGLSVDNIAKNIMKSAHFGWDRAKLIAQTEVVSASNAANHFSIGANMSTRGMTKAWASAGDRRVRPSHADADATQVDIPYNEPFTVGGSQLMFPGDGSLGAPGRETIRCRCTALYYPGR